MNYRETVHPVHLLKNEREISGTPHFQTVTSTIFAIIASIDLPP
jgi:hypothetical protein